MVRAHLADALNVAASANAKPHAVTPLLAQAVQAVLAPALRLPRSLNPYVLVRLPLCSLSTRCSLYSSLLSLALLLLALPRSSSSSTARACRRTPHTRAAAHRTPHTTCCTPHHAHTPAPAPPAPAPPHPLRVLPQRVLPQHRQQQPQPPRPQQHQQQPQQQQQRPSLSLARRAPQTAVPCTPATAAAAHAAATAAPTASAATAATTAACQTRLSRSRPARLRRGVAASPADRIPSGTTALTGHRGESAPVPGVKLANHIPCRDPTTRAV